jgi:hypothetical protein
LTVKKNAKIGEKIDSPNFPYVTRKDRIIALLSSEELRKLYKGEKLKLTHNTSRRRLGVEEV